MFASIALLALLSTPAHAQQTVELSIKTEFPEKIGMIMSSDGMKLKGKDKNGDCEAALADAQTVTTSENVVVIPMENGKITDVVECEINKKNVATVKYQVVVVRHKPTTKVPELTFVRALEILEAVRSSPSVGASDFDNYSFGVTEADGLLLFDARTTDESQTFPIGTKVEIAAAKSFYDMPMSAWGAMNAMSRVAAAIPEVDGFNWTHTFKIAKPDSDGGGYTEHRVRLVFTRDGLTSSSPREVLRAARAFLIGRQGAETPLTLQVNVVPEKLPG